MPNLLLVMIGGAAGAGLRYEAGRATARALGTAFPWGTLAVNLAGGLAIGILAALIGGDGAGERPAWLLLAVGLLGGFTTFSAFGLDMFAMLQRGETVLAVGYAAASVLGTLVLLAAGHGLAKAAAA